jgi:hypothetical protein
MEKPRIRIVFSGNCPGQILFWRVPVNLSDGPVAIYSQVWKDSNQNNGWWTSTIMNHHQFFQLLMRSIKPLSYDTDHN